MKRAVQITLTVEVDADLAEDLPGIEGHADGPEPEGPIDGLRVAAFEIGRDLMWVVTDAWADLGAVAGGVAVSIETVEPCPVTS